MQERQPLHVEKELPPPGEMLWQVGDGVGGPTHVASVHGGNASASSVIAVACPVSGHDHATAACHIARALACMQVHAYNKCEYKEFKRRVAIAIEEKRRRGLIK